MFVHSIWWTLLIPRYILWRDEQHRAKRDYYTKDYRSRDSLSTVVRQNQNDYEVWKNKNI